MREKGLEITNNEMINMLLSVKGRVRTDEDILRTLAISLFKMIQNDIDSTIIDRVIQSYMNVYLKYTKTYYFYNYVSNLIGVGEIEIFKNYLNKLIESKVNEKK